jgi:hypothetical protein
MRIRLYSKRRSRRSTLGSERKSRRSRHQRCKASTRHSTIMEDLKLYYETHGHVNVSIPEDKSLAQFCAQARHASKNPDKSNGKQLTNKCIAAFDALGFNWTSKEYITRSFDERIEDLEEYERTHGHLNVNRHEDNSLYQFCAGVRHSLKQVEKDGRRKLTEERMARLDALGFKW